MRKFYLNGKKVILSNECRKRGLDYASVYQRIKSGWSVEDALSKPIERKNCFEFNGIQGSLKYLCQEFKWNESFIFNQIYVYKRTLSEAVEALSEHTKRSQSLLLRRAEEEKIKEQKKKSDLHRPILSEEEFQDFLQRYNSFIQKISPDSLSCRA